MSTAEKYRKRRCWALWLPAAAFGSIVVAYSHGLTATANGLTVVGLIVLTFGAASALYESRQ